MEQKASSDYVEAPEEVDKTVVDKLDELKLVDTEKARTVDEDSDSVDEPGTYSVHTEVVAKLILKIAKDCDVQNLLMIQDLACQYRCNEAAVKEALWLNLDFRKDLHKVTESWAVDQWINTEKVMLEQIAAGNMQKIRDAIPNETEQTAQPEVKAGDQ